MFILEEGMQTLMFASFNYKNTEDWYGLKSHLVIMKAHHSFSSAMIRYAGWLAPLMYPSYLSYERANAAYIKSIERTLKREL